MNKTIHYFTFPAAGHLNGSKALCRELIGQGARLICYTIESEAKRFHDVSGMIIRYYPKEFEDTFREKDKQSGEIKKNIPALLEMLYGFAGDLMPFTLQQIEQDRPDLVLVDPFCLQAKMAARKLAIPVCFMFTLFLADPVDKTMSSALKRSVLSHLPTMLKAMKLRANLMKRYQVACDSPAEIFEHQNERVVSSVIREFHDHSEAYPERVIFMGPPQLAFPDQPKEDMILLSFGTVEENRRMILAAIDAIRGLPYQLVITLAGNEQNRIDPSHLPANVKLYDNMTPAVFQDHLARAACFINSGGINSISESIAANTPLVICPNSPETYDVGKRMEYRRCALVYEHSQADPDVLRDIIQKIIQQPQYRRGIGYYRQKLQEAMGAKQAARILLQSIQ